jgi:hypothetical protein
MPKKQNDFFVVILFSIIWIVRPISYDEMRIRHPNKSFEFLESTTKKIILAKDTSGSFCRGVYTYTYTETSSKS